MRDNQLKFAGGEGAPIITAAHELKSPLALIRQLSILANDGNLSVEQLADNLAKIQLTSERALRLTSDLTKVSRLDDAMFELEPVNPVQLCYDIVTELKPLLDAHNKSVRIFARKKHPLLLIANRDLLRRIILNFADNAITHNEDTHYIDLAISTLNHGKIVRLSVRDFGPSMRLETWRDIKRGLPNRSQTVVTRPLSSGLGIYIAGQFAESMNGKIGLTRHSDGLTFYVDLQASTQTSFI